MSLQRRWILLGMFAAVMTCFGVFILPFLLPPQPIAAISVSNVAGFNNRLAAVAAALISIVVLLAAWKQGLRIPLPSPAVCRPMTKRFVVGWAAGLTLALALLATVVYLTDGRYLGDYGYFIEQMRKGADYHRRLYTEIEFPYGPLLFYPTIWLRPLFAHFRQPMAASYIVTLLLHQFFGLLLVAYVLHVLPIERQLRRWTYISATLFTFILSFGVNYTFLRFIAPIACLLFCIRRRGPGVASLLVFAGQVVSFGVSPEIGLAFGSGAVAFAVIEWWRQRQPIWLAVVGSVVLALLLLFTVFGSDSLSMVRQFSGGTYNLIVQPQPEVLVYLFALIWLVPAMLATLLIGRAPEASIFAALFVAGLALLPVAFGRTDTGHVIFDGLPILLLALIPVSVWRLRWRVAAVSIMLALVLVWQFVILRSQRFGLQAVAVQCVVRFAPASVRRDLLKWRTPTAPGLAEKLMAEHPSAPPPFDVERLSAITGGEPVATFLDPSPEVEEALQRAHLYIPDYYAYMMGVLNRNAEEHDIALTNQAKWLLKSPANLSPFTETPTNMVGYELIPLRYPTRGRPFYLGKLTNENIAKNWQPVTMINNLMLYHRRW